MANTVDKVITIAEAEVGYLEKKSNSQLYDKTANAGSANYTKYGKEMHDIYPQVMDFPAAWCDAFTDWCFYKAYGVANAKGLLGGNFDDYTVASAQLYKNKKAWYTSNPKVGDQIFFTNSKGGICHTGLVYKVDKYYIYTIEGNTSGASGVIANGGGVCKKKYPIKYNKIAGFGRPKYDEGTFEKKEHEIITTVVDLNDSSQNVVFYRKGDSGEKVKQFQNWLISLGYDLGKYGADGKYGNDTVCAVKSFQKDYGVEQHGEYDRITNGKLRALIKVPFKAKAIKDSDIRTGAGENFNKRNTVPKGRVVSIFQLKNGYGRGIAGWVNLKDFKRVK